MKGELTSKETIGEETQNVINTLLSRVFDRNNKLDKQQIIKDDYGDYLTTNEILRIAATEGDNL